MDRPIARNRGSNRKREARPDGRGAPKAHIGAAGRPRRPVPLLAGFAWNGSPMEYVWQPEGEPADGG